MKKTLSVIAIAFVIMFASRVPFAKALASYFTITSSATATSTVSTVNINTNYTYNLSGGLSTLMADVDSSHVFALVTASSTATTVSWVIQYSNDNVNWFDADNIIAPVVGVPIVHASSTNTWIVGTTTPQGKIITIPTVASLYKRVVFGATVGTSTLWVQDTEKRNASGN